MKDITLLEGSRKEKLEKQGWTVVPKGVWFGIDYADAHKARPLDTLTDLLHLDTNVEGYNFLVIGYKEEK